MQIVRKCDGMENGKSYRRDGGAHKWLRTAAQIFCHDSLKWKLILQLFDVTQIKCGGARAAKAVDVTSRFRKVVPPLGCSAIEAASRRKGSPSLRIGTKLPPPDVFRHIDVQSSWSSAGQSWEACLGSGDAVADWQIIPNDP